MLPSVLKTYTKLHLPKSVKGPKCLNCEKLLHGENYCPQCGQKNDQRKQGIVEYIRSSLAYILGADSRLVTTLKPLIFQPGRLPLEYNSGKKERFVPPLRLFIWLFLSILIVQKIDSWNEVEEEINPPLIHVGNNNIDSSDAHFNSGNTSFDSIANFALRNPLVTESRGLDTLQLPKTLRNRLIYRFFHRLAEANRSSLLKSFLDRLLMMLLLFTPFFALWLKLIYIRQTSIYLLDHMVFILYNHALLFLLILLGIMSEWMVSWDSSGVIILIYGVYIWLAFKRFYGQSTWRRMLKFALASIGFAGMAIALFILNGLAAILLN